MDILTKERAGKHDYQCFNGGNGAPAANDDDEMPFKIEVEDTCLVALATTYNAREADGGNTKHELLQFVEECFNLPPEKLKQVKKKAKTTDKPELYLKCKVLRATGLTAKDANGLSDPYCKLGILNEAYQDKHIVKHKDLDHWQKEQLIECVAGTTVKQATLEPAWNEEFYLSVTEPSKEMLVLEVWDSDEPTETENTKIKGIRGFGVYLAEKTIHKGDDFMGRLFYNLRSIPNAGEKKTFVLFSHSGKTQHGFVTLQLSIGAKERKIPLQKRLSEFSALTQALVNYCAKKDGKYLRRWNGLLCPMAERLLEHHAMLNNVDTLQRTCIQFSVLVKYHKLHTVDMKVLCDLIQTVKGHHSVFTTATQEEWKQQLLADLKELAEDTESVLMNHLTIFNIDSKSDVAKIEERVKPYTEQLPPGGDSLKATLEKCVAAAVPKWFRVLDAKLLPEVDTEAENLASFVSLSEHCLDQCQRAFKILSPIFNEAGVDYFSYFYVSLDNLISAEATERLEEYRSSSDPSTFAIYRSFKGMADMMKYVDKSMCDSLAIANFHKWFKDMVRGWIRMAMDKCKDYTAKAVAADSTTSVTNDVMFSTSALDTTGFLIQVGSFWKHLEWPVASVAYGHAVYVMQAISECALFYVGEVVKKLGREDMFDENGRFRASEKLCIVLNNMQHIRQELSKVEETMQLQSFYNWLDKEEQVGSRCKELVRNLLESADEDIYNKMNKIMLEITEKLSPDIKKFVLNLSADNRVISDEEAIDPLLEFLHSNLQTFVSHLYPAVLKIILCNMWQVSVDSIEKCLEDAPLKKGTDSAQIHQRLFTTLETMRDFYSCGGDGLEDKELESENYMTLSSKLNILRLPTDKLMHQFFSDVANCQHEELKQGRTELGTLLVSVGYLKEKSVLEVDIIQGKGLPGLDKSGLSDPFVQLTLMPTWAFAKTSNNKHFKTTVRKQTLDPFFNESFKLPAKQTEMDKDGTVLLLSVFDHDVVGANDFAGMCVVACKDIPQLVSTERSFTDPNAPQRKNLTLPLFRISYETPAFAELDTRSHLGDAKAVNFFKMNKTLSLLGDLSHIRHRTSLLEGINISVHTK